MVAQSILWTQNIIYTESLSPMSTMLNSFHLGGNSDLFSWDMDLPFFADSVFANTTIYGLMESQLHPRDFH